MTQLFLLLAFLPSLDAPKKPPKKAGIAIDAPAQVKQYFPVSLKLKDAAATTQSRWTITPKPVWSEDIGGGGKRFTGSPGVYAYRVLYVDFDAKLFGEIEGEVEIVGDAPAPPPTPIDADYSAFKLAIAADTPVDAGLKKLNAASLAKYYRDTAAKCSTSTAPNVETLFKEINDIAAIERVGLGLPKTRDTIVGPAVNAVFPKQTRGDTPVTLVQRQALAAVFTKYAGYLEAYASGR